MAKLTSELVDQLQSASQQFDVVSLFDYCRSHVHGFPSSAHPSHFSIRQFGHGQSNPTFLLEVSLGGSGKKMYVLRKKPHGKLLQSAHAVEREYQVLHALGNHTTVPVPKVFCLCTDTSVIGTAFYIMEYLEGRIFLDPTLPGVAPPRRNAIYRETARVLASLHQCDVDAIGLGKFGRLENYCKRQVERWAQQYMASTGEGKPARNPKMLELVSWLQQNIPLEDSSKTAAGLVHGDFRIDNLVFHPIEDRVIGILDWELSTLGNQMCDVAYSCLHYVVNFALEGQDKGLEQIGIPEGMPSVAEYLADYCHAARKPWPVADWKFYVAFSLFRGAAIYAGIYSRWVMGNALGGTKAKYSGTKANVLIDSALSLVKQNSVLPERPPSAMKRAMVEEMTTKIGKLNKFEGIDFRRWQKKMHFLISTLKVGYVINMPRPPEPEEGAPPETIAQIRDRNKWDNDDFICRGHILNGMTDGLFDLYQNVESARVLWDMLEDKYMAEDASSRKFLVSNFNSYKMVDSRPVLEQYHELLRILGQFTQHGMNMDEAIAVSSIMDKLPNSWKEFRHMLKHKKEDLSLVELGSHLRIEEGLRAQENGGKPATETTSADVNMLDDKPGKGKGKGGKGKGKRQSGAKGNAQGSQNDAKKPKGACWTCGKPGHFKRDCRSKGKASSSGAGSGQGGQAPPRAPG